MSIGEGLQFHRGKSLIREVFLEVQSMMASRMKRKKKNSHPERASRQVRRGLQNRPTACGRSADDGSRSIIPVRQPIAPAALASSSTSTVRQVIPRSS